VTASDLPPLGDGIDLLAEVLRGREGVLEAASEIQPKRRKRGRTRKHPFYEWAFGSSEAKSDHRRANSRYASCAASFLFDHRKEHPEVLELTGFTDMGGSAHFLGGHFDTRKWKLGIRAELGRMMDRYSDGEAAALKLAIEFSRIKPRLTTKEAIGWIRNYRLKRQGNAGTAKGLYRVLVSTLNEYMSAHPGTPVSEAVDALSVMILMLEKREQEPPE
jgi:hypothetical protein